VTAPEPDAPVVDASPSPAAEDRHGTNHGDTGAGASSDASLGNRATGRAGWGAPVTFVPCAG
jgi:hypothetical protein